MELPERIGQRIRRRREELGMTQQELAGRELTRGFISQLEKGIVTPSLKSLELIAARLYRPISYFLDGGPDAETAPPQGPGEIGEIIRRAEAHLFGGRTQEAATLLAQAATQARPATDASPLPAAAIRRLEALRAVLAALGDGGAKPGPDSGDAPADLRQALSALRGDAPPYDLASAAAVYGLALVRERRWEAAAEVLEEAERLAGHVAPPDPLLVEIISTCRSIALAHLGHPHEALPRLSAAWERQQAAGVCVLPVEVAVAMGHCRALAGEVDQAVETLKRAARLGEVLERPGSAAWAFEVMGQTLEGSGQTAQAAGAYEKAAATFDGAGRPGDAGRVELRLGRLLLRAGESGRAIPPLDRAHQRLSGSDRTASLLLLGQALAREHRDEEARRVLEAAVRSAQESSQSRELALACSELGKVLIRQGQHASASEYLARAVTVYEEAGR